MNQNNMQNQVRQISPEEVQQIQGRQLTQEELQKTQVLNLQEVEETARFEKLTSKKPAIIVAIIGALFITFGTTFQIAKSLSTKPEQVVENRVKEDSVKSTVETTYLNCTKTTLNNANGTDTVFNIAYTFEDGKLGFFTKVYTMNATVGAPNGEETIQVYLKNYQAFLNQTDGYQISVVPVDNGLITTVQVDYEKLDLTKLPEVQQSHFSTKVDYPMDTDEETIKNDMISQGFTCE